MNIYDDLIRLQTDINCKKDEEEERLYDKLYNRYEAKSMDVCLLIINSKIVEVTYPNGSSTLDII